MYIVPIAWIYVALMMSVAEATNSNGTVMGAIFTFLIYGLLPVGLVVYIMGTPGRKRAIRAREEKERTDTPSIATANSDQTDASHLPAGDPLPPVGKET